MCFVWMLVLYMYALPTASLVLGRSSRFICLQDICSWYAVRTCDCDTRIRFLARYKFVTYLLHVSVYVSVCSSVECSVLCMRTLLKLLQHYIIYKDVFREIGLIEVMVTCLQRYAALLKDVDSGSGTASHNDAVLS